VINVIRCDSPDISPQLIFTVIFFNVAEPRN